MEAVLGSNLAIFVAITIVIMGFATFMAGQALATLWRPLWHVIPYTILLGMADRFLSWALFGGELFALVPYLVNTAVLFVVILVAYRLTQVRKMVTQYPWLYDRVGPFGWRQKAG
ncbi:MAG TPA: hypothetical protein VKY65_05380 [Alphaproteobacteria bacterium]|nr:hypothetical protein [Alphaproteobacteria bacterium]